MKKTLSTSENPSPGMSVLPQLPEWTDTPAASEAKRLLDAALANLRQCGHLVPHVAESRNFRWLVEYAGAFVREAWIAADGQNAVRPHEVFSRCEDGRRICETAEAMARSYPPCSGGTYGGRP